MLNWFKEQWKKLSGEKKFQCPKCRNWTIIPKSDQSVYANKKIKCEEYPECKYEETFTVWQTAQLMILVENVNKATKKPQNPN